MFNRRYIFKRSIFYCHVGLLEGNQPGITRLMVGFSHVMTHPRFWYLKGRNLTRCAGEIYWKHCFLEETNTLRLFQHTELEHTPSNLYEKAKEGFLSILGERGIAETVCDIGVCWNNLWNTGMADGGPNSCWTPPLLEPFKKGKEWWDTQVILTL